MGGYALGRFRLEIDGQPIPIDPVNVRLPGAREHDMGNRASGFAGTMTCTMTPAPARADVVRNIAAFCWAPDLLPAGPQREAERKRQRRRIRNLNVRA